MITLYAITDHPTPPLPDDSGMRLVTGGELAAVCAPARPREVTADALWEHERLVEALMDDRDLLPVRYGTCLPDAEAVTRTLEHHQAAYSAALAEIRGAVELAVRVFPAGEAAPSAAPAPPATPAPPAAPAPPATPAPPAAPAPPATPAPPAAPAPPPATGTGYLRARAESTAAESEAVATVHAPLARLARAATLARLPRAGELLRAAYLVDRTGTSAFAARVQEIQERSPRLLISCTGPWPPYSFAAS